MMPPELVITGSQSLPVECSCRQSIIIPGSRAGKGPAKMGVQSRFRGRTALADVADQVKAAASNSNRVRPPETQAPAERG